VITGEVIVGKPWYPLEVFLVDVSEHPNYLKGICGIPDIVQHALEVGYIVGECQFSNGGVAGLEAERVRDAVPRKVSVLPAPEIFVRVGNVTLRDEVVDSSRMRQRIEVTTQQNRYLSTICVLFRWSRLLCGISFLPILIVAVSVSKDDLVFASWKLSPLAGKSRNSLHQDSDLHKLHVRERGVPEDVYVSDDESCASGAVLQESNHGDIVSRHDTVEDVVLSLHIRSIDGSVGKIDELLVEKNVPVAMSISFAFTCS
jgi:hypothetical protein